MHSKHAQIYSKLQPEQIGYLWKKLHEQNIVGDTPGDDLSQFLQCIDPLSHAEVVLALSNETSAEGLKIVETLIEKPIYMCARGESGAQLTDVLGRPLAIPIGHRRGELPNISYGSGAIQVRVKEKLYKIDNRVITYIAPNPKRPGSNAWHRYNQYQLGKSLDFHTREGLVKRADIRWDLHKGYLQVESPNAHIKNTEK